MCACLGRFGGKIQTSSIHQQQEAVAAVQLARRTWLKRITRILTLPLTFPFEALFALALGLVRWVRRSDRAEGSKELKVE